MTVPYDLEQAYRELIEKILMYSPSVDVNRIRRAFDLAVSAHDGQLRRDGTPYVSHPIAVTEIVVDMGLDEDSLVAALLHDVLEDTAVTYEEMVKKAGQEVADIVEGVTKLTRVQYTSREEEQMENLRKMLVAMGRDIRVILIKIADRLHNMRTMAYQTEDKQLSKSEETMHIYAPIAHRLGMQKIKWELEDSALLYLDPDGNREISEFLESKHDELENFMNVIEEQLRLRLKEEHINGTVQSRIKHTYSIYRKMYTQDRELGDIFDLCAFRVIVDDITTCYQVLGYVHDMWNPILPRFKDHIAMPKPNLYQSLHSTLIGSQGTPFEVQIRTWDMHQIAEYGIAAHWKYKKGNAFGLREDDEEKFAWIRRLLEAQQDADAQDFFHDLKVDMFADEVFVFTPKGDIVSLPTGASPIDFAYSIHSAIGNHIVGAKIGGKIAPISRELQTGDIVEILTANNATPSRDWLAMIKSGQARSKIRQWFKNERREENIIHGKAAFDSELRRAGLRMQDITNDEIFPVILKKIAVGSLDDIYASIGYGGMTASHCVKRIKDEITKAASSTKSGEDKISDQLERIERNKKNETKPINGVLVQGLDGCLIKFSRCCTPVPGDDIVGFTTRGYGVSVHRSDCANYRSSVTGSVAGEERWIAVRWASDPTDGYLSTLKIAAREHGGLIVDIATVLNALSTKIRSLTAKDVGTDSASATVSVEVKNLDELRTVIGKLKAIQGVTEVSRTGAS